MLGNATVRETSKIVAIIIRTSNAYPQSMTHAPEGQREKLLREKQLDRLMRSFIFNLNRTWRDFQDSIFLVKLFALVDNKDLVVIGDVGLLPAAAFFRVAHGLERDRRGRRRRGRRWRRNRHGRRGPRSLGCKRIALKPGERPRLIFLEQVEMHLGVVARKVVRDVRR